MDRILSRPPILPDAELLSTVILPLVARRNARDLGSFLVQVARLNEPVSQAGERVLQALSHIDHSDLDRLFTSPEITDVAELVRQGRASNAEVGVLTAFVDGITSPWDPDSWVRGRHENCDHDEFVYNGGRVVIHGLPCAWLEARFPERAWLSRTQDMGAGLEQFKAARLLVEESWPAASLELDCLLRWVVPLNLSDSFNVPSMRGMVAAGFGETWRLAADLVHESSHNVLSSVLDLRDVSRRPLELVHSPFVNTNGPLTSLIHSCWSFVRELGLLRRMVDCGVEVPRYEPIRRKTLAFWRLAEPVLRAHEHYTEFGDLLVDCLMEQCHEMSR